MRKYFTRLSNHVLKRRNMLAILKSAQHCEITGLRKCRIVACFIRHFYQSKIQTCFTFDFQHWIISLRLTMSNKTKYSMQRLSSTRLTVAATATTNKQKMTWVWSLRPSLLWCISVRLVCSTLGGSISYNARSHSAFCCISFVKNLPNVPI